MIADLKTTKLVQVKRCDVISIWCVVSTPMMAGPIVFPDSAKEGFTPGMDYFTRCKIFLKFLVGCSNFANSLCCHGNTMATAKFQQPVINFASWLQVWF